MISTCHRCPLRERPFAPPVCRCTVDMRDIIEHARTGECPHPDGSRFVNIPCPRCGGAHDPSACPIPADTSPETERAKARQGGCCGQPSARET